MQHVNAENLHVKGIWKCCLPYKHLTLRLAFLYHNWVKKTDSIDMFRGKAFCCMLCVQQGTCLSTETHFPVSVKPVGPVHFQLNIKNSIAKFTGIAEYSKIIYFQLLIVLYIRFLFGDYLHYLCCPSPAKTLTIF